MTTAADAAVGEVKSHQKISDTEGGFTGILADDRFGTSAVSIGDLDGDGVGDLAVGAFFDDDGGNSRGAVWVLFLNTDGTVKAHQKISSTQGGFGEGLSNFDYFGNSVASLGDLDGDGVQDLAVGARGDHENGTQRGAVWVLFLNTDGTVKAHQKINETQGGFSGVLDNADWFSWSISGIGDLDSDGVVDLVVSAAFDDDGGGDRGAVWILFLNSNGTVKSHQKISSTQGGFTGVLDNADYFGSAVADLGDVDGDGVVDLAAGALYDDDGSGDRGAVWILFLNSNGTVKSHQKISSTHGGFTGVLESNDRFGHSLTSLGDLDCDGVADIAVGAFRDDDGGSEVGAAWVLFLNSNGTVKTHQKISATMGGFTGDLDNSDYFGISVASLGDLNGDGIGDLAVGAEGDDDGGSERGAVWVLFLDGRDCTVFLDIKPGSCPNPLNVKMFESHSGKGAKAKKGGVLPVAILGTEAFDVYDVDVSTLLLEGVAQLRHGYEDVTAPLAGGEECECTTAGPDDYLDLTLKFDTMDIVAALGPVFNNEYRMLTLTGTLLDGTPFVANDCVRILSKNDPPVPEEDGPDAVILRPVAPNPFNPIARISYVLSSDGFVRLSVYDVTGRLLDRLVDRAVSAGEHVVTWDATGLPSGVYFYRLEVGDFSETRKMILLK